MGGVVSLGLLAIPWAIPLAISSTLGFILSGVFRPAPNRTLTGIAGQLQAEAALRQAEQNAAEAREVAQRAQREAEEERECARKHQEQAQHEAERARAEAQQMMDRMAEAQQRAAAAHAEAEAAASAGNEDAARLAQEAEDERERVRQLQEQTRKAQEEARKEAERASRVAREERRKADIAREEAEKASRTAREEVERTVAAKEEMEQKWREGVQPVVMPTAEELETVKNRVQYKEGLYHLAIAGISGSGKSSMLNAFCSLHNNDPRAAATGIIETTTVISRYPDPNPRHPFVWYDIPGAGTLNIPDWQYFNAQGLYVFDCIIVLIDNRFTMTDIAILSNSKRFNIPTYIVRSKADQHIQNMVKEMGYDRDDEDQKEDVQLRDRLYTEARQQFIDETRENIRTNLENANLPDQRVYIVSKNTMLGIIEGKTPRKVIDEIELLGDLVRHAYARRGSARDTSSYNS